MELTVQMTNKNGQTFSKRRKLPIETQSEVLEKFQDTKRDTNKNWSEEGEHGQNDIGLN